MENTTTDAQINMTVTMMAGFAKEPVTVESISGTLYVFGSELACLRIFAKYNTNGAAPNSKARVGYSKNRATWYFSLETAMMGAAA